jgi:nucleoid DNA-binding protein
MKNLTLKKVFSDLSTKYKLPEHVIEEVFNSQFRVVKNIIESKDCSANIKLPYFGTFTNKTPKNNTTISKSEHDKLINNISDEFPHDSITLLAELTNGTYKYKRAVKFKKIDNVWTIDNKFKILDENI